MASYSAWAPFYKHFKSNGDRFVLLSLNNFNYNALMINTFDLYFSQRRFNDFLSTRRSSLLNDKEEVILKDLISDRFDGNSRFSKITTISTNLKWKENLEELLKIDKRKNIFLFSNVFWDIGISSYSFLFKDIQEYRFFTQ